MKTPKNVVRKSIAALAVFAAGAISVACAGTVTWVGGSGGTIESPLNLYQTSNWSNNALPSSANHYELSVDSPTVLTNTAPYSKSIADHFRPYQGTFTILGNVYMNVLGYGAPVGNATIIKRGDWKIDWDFMLGHAANSYLAITNESGNLTTKNSTEFFGYGNNSTVIIDKLGGDWFLNKIANFGRGAGSVVRFYNRGGSLTFATYASLGDDASVGEVYFEISGGAVSNTSAYAQIGNTGPATMTVKRGGSYTGNTGTGTPLYLSMSANSGASGTLNIEGGEVLLNGALGCHYAAGNANSTINITEGGLLTCSRIYQAAGTSDINITIDDGTIRACASRTDFLPDYSYLHLKVGSGGATFDADKYDITIASDMNDADGASGPVTFTGDNGTIRLTGAQKCTGAINLNEKTHLVVKDSAMKTAILPRGITVVKPKGSAKGTYTIFSIADGTPCTTGDLGNIRLGAGLEAAELSVVDGKITVNVTYSEQTWTGPAGASAPWSGANWDGGETFDNGNKAMFAVPNAIAEVDAEAEVLSITFKENATLTGSGALTAPTVIVSNGVSATISAPTAGDLEKTGAGTLVLGSSRTATTTLSEGTLAMAGGATLNGGFALGSDPTKPLTLDYGGGTYSANLANLIHDNCEATFRNGTFGSGSFVLKGGKTLRIGEGGRMNLTTWTEVGNGGVGHFEIDGGVVTNSGNYLQIGHSNVGTMTVKNGGKFTKIGEGDYASLWLSVTANGSGTLNVQGGEVFLGGRLGFHYYGGDTPSALNVTDGGVLTMSSMYQKAGSSAVAVTIDNGTLRAYADSTAFIPNQSYISLTVGEGGGTIDSNGKNITIAKQFSGEGGVSFVGGGVVTLSSVPAYSGTTTAEVGTLLVLPAAVAGSGLAFTIPENLAAGVYEVVKISGSGTFAADVLSTASLPGDPNARFCLGPDSKSIFCVYGCGNNNQIWIGASGGSLSEASNWLSGSVPTSGDAIIGRYRDALTLANNGSFAPGSITFPAGSAAVTINGNPISGVTAITNLSASVQTFNAAVTFADTYKVFAPSAQVKFPGGATATHPDNALRTAESSVYTRTLDGTFTFTEDWVVNNVGDYPWIVPNGSEVHGQLFSSTQTGNHRVLHVEAGGSAYFTTVTNGWERGDLDIDGYMEVSGEVIVRTAPDGHNPGNFGRSGNRGTVKARKIAKIEHATVKSYIPNLIVGAGGIGCIERDYYWQFNADTTVEAYESFNCLGVRSGYDWGLHLYDKTVTFNVPSGLVVTNGVGLQGYGTLKKSGAGTLVMTDNYNGQSGFMKNHNNTIIEGGTLAVAANSSMGYGTVTVDSGAKLMVAKSAAIALGANLTLADDAVLGFNFTGISAAPVLDVTGKTVTLGEGANVKVGVSAAADLRPNGNDYVVTSGGGFTGANVSLVEPAPRWVKSVGVDGDGNIVITVKPSGTMLIVF